MNDCSMWEGRVENTDQMASLWTTPWTNEWTTLWTILLLLEQKKYIHGHKLLNILESTIIFGSHLGAFMFGPFLISQAEC